jgi:hypothetical protein
LFDLGGELPIGAFSVNRGHVGVTPSAVLLQGFRRHLAQTIDPVAYRMADVAGSLGEYVLRHARAVDAPDPAPGAGSPGFVVVGYSADSEIAEAYRLEIAGGKIRGPESAWPADGPGMIADGGGARELRRFVVGFDPEIPNFVAERLNLSPAQRDDLTMFLKERCEYPLVQNGMPLLDAAALADYLVRQVIGLVPFLGCAPGVGGAADLAVVTRHEGFRWLRSRRAGFGTLA